MAEGIDRRYVDDRILKVFSPYVSFRTEKDRIEAEQSYVSFRNKINTKRQRSGRGALCDADIAEFIEELKNTMRDVEYFKKQGTNL